MADVPETHYAVADDGVHIAYQVLGDGPFDLVVVPGFISMSSCCGTTRPSPTSPVASRRSPG